MMNTLYSYKILHKLHCKYIYLCTIYMCLTFFPLASNKSVNYKCKHFQKKFTKLKKPDFFLT